MKQKYPNRLKAARRFRRLTQQEVAERVGVQQNTYSYWENGSVPINSASLNRLADIFGVSADFLSGREYRIKKPVSEWRSDLQEDYAHGDSWLREIYEYRYGEIEYLDDWTDADRAHGVLDDIGKLTDREKTLIIAFREIGELLGDEAQEVFIKFGETILTGRKN